MVNKKNSIIRRNDFCQSKEFYNYDLCKRVVESRCLTILDLYLLIPVVHVQFIVYSRPFDFSDFKNNSHSLTPFYLSLNYCFRNPT